jgi:hypothetical protein
LLTRAIDRLIVVLGPRFVTDGGVWRFFLGRCFEMSAATASPEPNPPTTAAPPPSPPADANPGTHTDIKLSRPPTQISTVKAYAILSAQNVVDLVDKVNRALKRGWTPLGAPFPADHPIGGTLRIHLHQAMTI